MSADDKTNRKDAVPSQDLESEPLSAEDAESVTGGFNPQPDPPGIVRPFDPNLSGIKQRGL